MLPTRTLWYVALTFLAAIWLASTVPAGVPLGFLPILEYGLIAAWLAWWDREITLRNEADVERFLASIAH